LDTALNPKEITMTFREEMLAVVAGDAVSHIPWAPRMDLWAICLQARDTLPERFKGMNTAEIADELGVACHAVRADYTLPRAPEDLALRGFGCDNHPDYPFRVELRDLPMEFEHDAENMWTRIRTPAGEVTTHVQVTAEMRRGGVSLPFVKKYPVESVDDLDAVAHVFQHMEVVPTPQAYDAFHQRIGHRGIAVPNGPLAASPVHLLLHELMPMDQFFFLYVDHRTQVHDFAQHLEPFYQAMLEAVVASRAEVVFWGANYDQDLTWPPFFAAEIRPWLQRVGERVHAAGKHLLTHTDGENRNLLDLFPSCGFDVAESVCPHPMTKLTLPQVRAGMGPDITVWGGIPSVALLPGSMGDQDFETYLDTLFAAVGDPRRLILGASDNVPPDADMARMDRIRDRAIEAAAGIGWTTVK
jgi:hypothetical protein